MSDDKNHPAAQFHGEIKELFSNVYWVQGTARMAPGLCMNRNMVVLRHQGELLLINPVRLSDPGEKALQALGEIKHILRLGVFHGLDDQYYKDKFSAQFWCQANSNHYAMPSKPDRLLNEDTELPFPDLKLFLFKKTAKPEAALLLQRHDGLLMTCDSLQHYQDWQGVSFLMRPIMRCFGFGLRTLIGPPWKKMMTPKNGSLKEDFESLMNLEFKHLVGAHGSPCVEHAKAGVRKAIDLAFTS